MYEITNVSKFQLFEYEELENALQNLLAEAAYARSSAYAPYSHFKVGAAILSTAGNIYPGCNVEDICFNGTIHAEACALGSIVAKEGVGAKVAVVAIVLDKEDIKIVLPPVRNLTKSIQSVTELTATPCGHCRAILAEHSHRLQPTKVVALQSNGQVMITTIADLYPAGFLF